MTFSFSSANSLSNWLIFWPTSRIAAICSSAFSLFRFITAIWPETSLRFAFNSSVWTVTLRRFSSRAINSSISSPLIARAANFFFAHSGFCRINLRSNILSSFKSIRQFTKGRLSQCLPSLGCASLANFGLLYLFLIENPSECSVHTKSPSSLMGRKAFSAVPPKLPIFNKPPQ